MRSSIAVFLLAFSPAALAAQQAQAGVSTETSATVAAQSTSFESTGNASADARIEAAFTRLDTEGMSSASLASRVQLGQSRGVEPARIAAGVESRADALLEARDALRTSGAARAEAMVELAADAIESGAHGSQVAAVVAAFEGESGARALTALGSLAAWGTVGADVVASVRTALGGGVGSGSDAASVAGAAGAGADVTGNVGGATNSVGASAGGVVRGVLQR